MGRLTTHVLDTARGMPAEGMALTLHALAPTRRLLVSTATNADGRVDTPLLEGTAFRIGAYELTFAAAAYHRAQGLVVAEPPFLEVVILRFQVADAEAHYHVPLLLSPWSYTTYRGS